MTYSELSSLWNTNIPLYLCTRVLSAFIHPWPLGCVPCLGYCKSCCIEHGSVNTSPKLILVLIAFEWIPNNRTVTQVMFLIRIFWGPFTLFAQCLHIFFSSAPRFQHLCLPSDTHYFCFVFNIGHRKRWYVSVILIFISLMVCDMEHLFIYLLVVCIFF